MLWGISSFVALFLHSAARALPRRDLGDLLPVLVGPELDDSDDSEPVPVKIQTPHSSHTEQVSTLFRIENSHVEIGTSALPQPTPARSTQASTAQLTTVVAGVSSHSHLTPTPTSTSRSPTPAPEGSEMHTSVTATSASQHTAKPSWYPSPLPPVSSASGIPQGHAIDWRVIGIAVIAVSVVGTMILIVVFFDQWWGFLCDVCGRRGKWGKEELVPDWERASWEFKVEDNASPAYPSFVSTPAIQVQEGVDTRAQPWKVDMAHGSDHLVHPPLWESKDNRWVIGTQGVPCRPSGQNAMEFSQSGVVNEVTTYKCHSPLSRSYTETTTSSEDAYDGLAA